jgi:hypothetical protein
VVVFYDASPLGYLAAVSNSLSPLSVNLNPPTPVSLNVNRNLPMILIPAIYDVTTPGLSAVLIFPVICF